MNFTKKEDLFVTYNKREKGQTALFLLIADTHFDAKHCDRVLLKKHCEEAKAKGAGILIFGDLFDAMGGKYDKRTSKSDIRTEYQTGDYFNAIVTDAYNFFKDYPVVFISEGNHEISIAQHHEINLTKMLAQMLNIPFGKFSGFLRFYFHFQNTNDIRGDRQSFDLYYTHGGGGNSPVTRGVIKTARRQVSINADIIVSGHIHNAWDLEIIQLAPNAAGKVLRKPTRHISLGCYKDDALTGGWADSKEFSPPNLGGYWLEFSSLSMKKTVFNVIKTI